MSNLEKLKQRSNKKLTLEFELLKGSYATMFLREILKPKNPSNQGF